MQTTLLFAVICSFNIIQFSDAGSPLDLDIFQSLNDKKGFRVVTQGEIEKKTKSIKRKIDSVDLCFLVDTTGSMRPHIQAVRDSIRDTINGLKARALRNLRVSFVGYRDFVDKEKKIQIIPFTTNLDNFLRKVEAIPATGGGDHPEDVYTGLQKAIAQNWRSQKRIILHMADAPCHGPGCQKTGSTSDPLGRDIEDIFRDARIKKLFYTFGRIKPTTNHMLTTFSGAYGRTIPVFEVHSTGKSGFGGPKGPGGKLSKKLGGGNRRAELKERVGKATFGAVILGITD